MSRSKPELVVPPLYFDALSGAFNPPSDPQARSHRLSRLALATFEKGSVVDEDNEHGLLFNYSPSWAPNVTSQLYCSRHFRRYGRSVVMTGLALESPNARNVAVDYRIENPSLFVGVGGKRPTQRELPLALGADLAVAEQYTTALASAFFIEAHLPTA